MAQQFLLHFDVLSPGPFYPFLDGSRLAIAHITGVFDSARPVPWWGPDHIEVLVKDPNGHVRHRADTRDNPRTFDCPGSIRWCVNAFPLREGLSGTAPQVFTIELHAEYSRPFVMVPTPKQRMIVVHPPGVAAAAWQLPAVGNPFGIVLEVPGDGDGVDANVAMPIRGIVTDPNDVFRHHVENIYFLYLLINKDLNLIVDSAILAGSIHNGIHFTFQGELKTFVATPPGQSTPHEIAILAISKSTGVVESVCISSVIVG